MEPILQAEEPPLVGVVEETLGKLREAIWHRRPILGDIMQRRGGKLLFEYAKDFMDVNSAPLLDPAKPELIDTASELIGQRLGPDAALRMKKQLKKLPLVSTADHHGPIADPFFVNANMVSSIPLSADPDPDINCLSVFSFSTVSLNNVSYPRGIQYHEEDGSFIKVPLLSDKMKTDVVYGHSGFTSEDVRRADSFLRQRKTAKADAVREIVQASFGPQDILACPDLCTQLTMVNERLWKKLFHTSRSEGGELTPIPDLFYLEIETLVTQLLLRRHLKENTLLHRLLFNNDFRRLIPQYFNDIPGAFSLTSGWGTHLFWGVDASHKRVTLMLQGDTLQCPKDECLSFAFTPEAIAQALKEGKMYPSMLLCYLTVSLYYGMKCLGGFCQVHDLTVTKLAWEKMLRELGETKEADALIPIQTKELGGDGMVLSYMRSAGSDDAFPATGIDMLLGSWDTSIRRYTERSKLITLTEIMNPMLPEIYKVLYRAEERDPVLSLLAPEDIVRETGLLQKLRAS